MLRLIKLAGSVTVLLALFIVVETVVTTIRPHKSIEAERDAVNRVELDRDAVALQTFIIAQGN